QARIPDIPEPRYGLSARRGLAFVQAIAHGRFVPLVRRMCHPPRAGAHIAAWPEADRTPAAKESPVSHLTQLKEIRERARKQIMEGAVTPDYALDRDQAVAILNEALATELVCVARYRFHYFMATGIHSQAIKEEFKEHADEEQEHADWLAERIKQLGGKPEMNPATVAAKAHSEYK